MKSLWMVACIVLFSMLPCLADDAVLDLFLGRWTTHVVIEKNGRRFEANGTAEGHPTLEGTFVEFRGHSLPPGESDLQLMTRLEDGSYYQWLFDSSGYRHEATGTWDPETRVLRWEGTLLDERFVIYDRFVGDDRLEWTLVHKDQDGTTVRKIEGVLVKESGNSS